LAGNERSGRLAHLVAGAAVMPDANDLSLAEWSAAVKLIRPTLTSARYAYPDENRALRAALAKLDPVRLPPEPFPGASTVGSPPKAWR
jgi:hypothetical protein